MSRSAAIVVASGALVAAIVWPVYGAHAGLVTAALVTALAAAPWRWRTASREAARRVPSARGSTSWPAQRSG